MIIVVTAIIVPIVVAPGVIQLIVCIMLTNYDIIVPIDAVIYVPNIPLTKFNLHQN